MITIENATILIKNTLNDERRYTHSLNVAKIMKQLAAYMNEDHTLWFLTGLLHDIDLTETINDLSRHGLEAESILEDKLPAIAIEAIKTHEYTTGLYPASVLGHSLIFADMFEIMTRTVSLPEMEKYISNKNWDQLKESHPNKEYHIERIKEFLLLNPDFDIINECSFLGG